MAPSSWGLPVSPSGHWVTSQTAFLPISQHYKETNVKLTAATEMSSGSFCDDGDTFLEEEFLSFVTPVTSSQQASPCRRLCKHLPPSCGFDLNVRRKRKGQQVNVNPCGTRTSRHLGRTLHHHPSADRDAAILVTSSP